jgi:hypothetical protein
VRLDHAPNVLRVAQVQCRIHLRSNAKHMFYAIVLTWKPVTWVLTMQLSASSGREWPIAVQLGACRLLQYKCIIT